MSKNKRYPKGNNMKSSDRNSRRRANKSNYIDEHRKTKYGSSKGTSNKSKNRKKTQRNKKISKVRLMVVLIVLFSLLFCIYKGVSFIKSKHTDNGTKTTTKTLSAEEIEKQNENIINIMIDPAKGGNNAGLSTKNLALTEKEINLKIAQLIRDDLLKYKDVRVMLTRDYDNDKKLSERAKLAKQNEVDIFVSIRVNAQAKGNEANGMDTYYSNLKLKPSLVEKKIQEDEEQNSVENSENVLNGNEGNKTNSVESAPKSKESERINLSKKLAVSIQETATSFIDFKDRGVVNNEYDVLKYTEMPAVIVHCGFITNKDDEKILENDEKLKDLADGISSGILYFIDHNKNDIIKDRINYR